MILSVTSQASIFIMSVTLGFFAGFVYDLFRILRKSIKHADFFTQMEDLIFWMFVSGLVFYFVLNKNSGEIRFFIILGTFLGMGLYFLTLSKPVMTVSMAVINFFRKVLIALYKIVSFPIRILIRLFLIPARALGIRVKKLQKPAKKLLQKPVRYAKIKTRSLARDLKIILKKV